LGQGPDQGRQLQADQAEHHAFQQEDHCLVHRVQLQPGLRGGDLGPARADGQPGDNHRHHRGDVQRRAEHVGRVRGDERHHGVEHRVGDMPAHSDDPHCDGAPRRGPASRQDHELPGAVQQEPTRRGPGSSCDRDGYGDLEQHQAGRVVEQALRLDQRLDPGWQGQPPPQR
jgi:hypothetical protein